MRSSFDCVDLGGLRIVQKTSLKLPSNHRCVLLERIVIENSVNVEETRSKLRPSWCPINANTNIVTKFVPSSNHFSKNKSCKTLNSPETNMSYFSACPSHWLIKSAFYECPLNFASAVH